MKKYYFKENEEDSFTKEYHLEYMKENDINKIDVFEAVVERGTGYFFCREVMEVGETGSCGKQCKYYIPRNGKSGICKHYGYVYDQGKKITLKLK